jgi:hypothetical protein
MITDLLYGVNSRVKKIKKLYPDENILAASATKAIQTTNDSVVRGFEWVIAKRAVLILTDKKIICGKWKFNLNDVEKAKLLKFSSFPIAGAALLIKMKDGSGYQFGLNSAEKWESQDTLELEIENTKMKYSLYSIVARAILIIIFLKYIFDNFI